MKSLKDNTYEIPLNDRSKELMQENEILKNKIDLLSNPDLFGRKATSTGENMKGISPEM